ncbi:MAG: EFR1 family ferrodoxin [Spirochaetia bacterium]|jgi:ferredoxin/flavodoxin|nr:EFR1 family ferrodoxin [Spirochaetia bacterium]
MSGRIAEPLAASPRVSILYFSGVGGTRVVAEVLETCLSGLTSCEVHSIEGKEAAEAVARANFLVLCYPTYFLKPAPAMVDFALSLPLETQNRKVALITTYELYTGNSNRGLARLLRDRGFTMAGAYELRAPGTDVTCVIPDWLCGWLYRFEGRFPDKIAKIAQSIAALAEAATSEGRIPGFKWYTPLAWPLQVLFLDGFIRWKDRMKVLEERCSGCGLCVRECHRGAWRRTDKGLEHSGETCDLCLRCLHHCPGRAIVLKPRLKDNRRLDTLLYQALSIEARGACKTEITATSQRENE